MLLWDLKSVAVEKKINDGQECFKMLNNEYNSLALLFFNYTSGKLPSLAGIIERGFLYEFLLSWGGGVRFLLFILLL